MKVGFIILFSIISFSLLAQGIDNLWLIGYPGGRIPNCCGGGMSLDFSGGNLTITQDTTRKMGFGETNGVICNGNGEFLFSSNGVWIANDVNDTMVNGSGLNPSDYTSDYADFGLFITQGNLIIPIPGDTNRYYLFHQTIDDDIGTYCSLHLYYSIIDVTGDLGRGTVIQKNYRLLNDSLIAGGLTACKHANGRDWWLIAHQNRTDHSNSNLSRSNLYYKFLVTPSGIFGPYTQAVGTFRSFGASGQCAFSPNGQYYATYDANSLDVFYFDRCTGNFSPKAHCLTNDTAFADGVAFSPNSQVLYVCTGYHVYQYDMNDSDIIASQTAVLSIDTADSTATGYFLAQLASDGKIYIASSANDNTMHKIDNPDILGSGCNTCHDCVILPALNAWTVANHPNYFLGAETGSVCDSLTGLTSALSKGEGVFKIFPNPVVDDEVTFTYNVSPQQGIITIYNVEGKEVAHYSLPQWSSVQHLKLPELASGLYLARLVQGMDVGSVKFLKE
jgi:hypothetical protein